MADEEQKQSRPSFWAMGEEIKPDDNSWGGALVSRDKYGRVRWVGNKEVERGKGDKAVKLGGQDVVRDPKTDRILKVGEKEIDWREEQALREYLDNPD